MINLRAPWALAGLLFLSACFPSTPLDTASFYKGKQTPNAFMVCHGFGCKHSSWASLSTAQWEKIKAPLTQKASSAEEERSHIAKSIALAEKITGTQIGTDIDKAGASAFEHGFFQMDCIDESANSSLYLSFLKEAGLLKWHDVAPVAQRGMLIDGRWPHYTAVITEKEGGTAYVVDSWFGKNGQKPDILPLSTWSGGWKPEGFVNGGL